MIGKGEERHAISTDIAIEGIRTAIMLLETELSVLENRRSDLYKRLNSFRVRYNAELGMLLGEILRFRIEEFRMLQDTNPDIAETVREAEADYAKHERAFHEVRDEVMQTLTKLKDKELQQKFHKASKLCHPDLVDESQRQRATEIFMDLSNAYYYNNLERVAAILQMLEEHRHGLATRSATLTNRAMLEMYELRLKTDIGRLKDEIHQIRTSKPFVSLQEIADEDRYFFETKRKLTNERDLLAQRIRKQGRVDHDT